MLREKQRDLEQVSIIIPAYNEEREIGITLAALAALRAPGGWIAEIIVVDDGSRDRTAEVAEGWAERVLRFPVNRGKSQAVHWGCSVASASILLLLDADLKESAAYAEQLVQPIWNREAEMSVAIFPPSAGGGFGLVKRFARSGIYRKTGVWVKEPLGGQRAVRKEVFEACYQGDRGFGLEVGLTLDILQAGFRLKELPLPFYHRPTGKSLAGFLHRFRQGVAVSQALYSRR